MKNQVPEEDILIEEESLTTRENLQNAKKLMEENHLADAIIVSDPIHMRRAMQIANDLGIKAWSSRHLQQNTPAGRQKFISCFRKPWHMIAYIVYPSASPEPAMDKTED